MKLWHYKLITYLPNELLLNQWEDLNEIFNNHGDITNFDYIFDYPDYYLYNYSRRILIELKYRKLIKTINIKNFLEYFNITFTIDEITDNIINVPEVNYKEHNFDYLSKCYFELYDKKLDNRINISDSIWKKINNLYKEESLKNFE